MRSRERIVGDRSVADDLCTRLTSLVPGRRRYARALDPDRSDDQRGRRPARRAALVEDPRPGVTLLCGSQADGLRFAPTVLSGVTSSMRPYGEESFRPVVTVVPADEADEAVRVLANDTEYGLSCAVFDRNVPRALDVATRLETAFCHVNGATVHDESQMPFGGVNWSGFGRFGGWAALKQFTELRRITVGGPEGRRYPI